MPLTSLDVNGVVFPSPQLIVPEKSLGVAPALASVNVVVRLVAVTPSTPPAAVTVPADSAASATVTLKVLEADRPAWSTTVTVAVSGPSSA